MTQHAHRFLFLGDLAGLDGHARHVYWCADCGTAVERFAAQVAEVVPAWSRERAAEAPMRRQDFSMREPPWKVTAGVGSRLGRGLADIQREHDKRPGAGLVALFGGKR